VFTNASLFANRGGWAHVRVNDPVPNRNVLNIVWCAIDEARSARRRKRFEVTVVELEPSLVTGAW
jgi:hypothetical protein